MTNFLVSMVRFAWRSFLLLSYLLLLLFPSMVLVNHHRRKNTSRGQQRADAVSLHIARSLISIFGVKVTVTGTPVQGPVLFVANHISWLDIPLIHTSAAMSFVGKAEIDRWPVFSYIARTGGTIFHQRGSQDSANDVAAAMVQRLNQGRGVTIFPEGGILPGSQVRVFHARMFRAAVEAECPVQPVMLRYMRNGLRDNDITFRDGESMMANLGRLLARPAARADVHFLTAIDATGKPRRELADAARAAVIRSYNG